MTLSNAVVLGGAGQVGELFARALARAGAGVLLVDLLPEPETAAAGRYLQADITRPGEDLRREIAGADCVVVSLPERVALASAAPVLGAMSGGALWVDVLSVKQDICRILKGYGDRLEAVSVHPLFAPALGFAGQPVAFVEISGGPKSRDFARMLRSEGASVEAVTPEEHDRLTAAIQVATHAAVLAFGAALRELAYDARRALALATPPHRTLLALLHRVLAANPEVYWDIQHYHPQADAVRRSLTRSLGALASASAADSPEDFRELCETIRPLLAPVRDALSETSDRIIAEAVARPAPPE